MKNSILILAAATFIAGATFSSCDTPKGDVLDAQENVAKANSNLDEATDNYIADIEQYRAETSEKIAVNDRTIVDLKASVENKDAATKAEYWKRIAELENKNRELKTRMDNYKADGKENWETFRSEFNHDMDGLGNAFRDVTVKNSK